MRVAERRRDNNSNVVATGDEQDARCTEYWVVSHKGVVGRVGEVRSEAREYQASGSSCQVTTPEAPRYRYLLARMHAVDGILPVDKMNRT